jgi:hypothetical protein
MQQGYVSIDDLVRNKIDEFPVEATETDWNNMNSLLDKEMSEKKLLWNKSKNYIFWGVSLVIVGLFCYQQWFLPIRDISTQPEIQRNSIEAHRVVISNEANKENKVEAIPFEKVVLKKTEPTSEKKVTTISNLTEKTKEVKPIETQTQIVKKNTSIPVKNSSFTPDDEDYKSQMNYMVIPRDSISYENMKKLKKKK